MNPAQEQPGLVVGPEFVRCVSIHLRKNGRCDVWCKNGHWVVEGPNWFSAVNQARRVWQEHWDAGHYANLFPTLTPELVKQHLQRGRETTNDVALAIRASAQAIHP